MPRGGRRPRAGKPKGYKHQRTLEREEARKYLQARVIAELDPVATGLLEAAKGTFVMFGRGPDGVWTRLKDDAAMLRCLQSGETFYRIVQQEPDVRAAQELLHQTIGRPTESLEVMGPAGGGIPIRIIHEHVE